MKPIIIEIEPRLFCFMEKKDYLNQYSIFQHLALIVIHKIQMMRLKLMPKITLLEGFLSLRFYILCKKKMLPHIDFYKFHKIYFYFILQVLPRMIMV